MSNPNIIEAVLIKKNEWLNSNRSCDCCDHESMDGKEICIGIIIDDQVIVVEHMYVSLDICNECESKLKLGKMDEIIQNFLSICSDFIKQNLTGANKVLINYFDKIPDQEKLLEIIKIIENKKLNI